MLQKSALAHRHPRMPGFAKAILAFLRNPVRLEKLAQGSACAISPATRILFEFDKTDII
ncbi:hypothetical protein FB480_103143 [Agrobacterium vitis]|nr:hypothetical protein FB480_103143 [Agrobacterium vitis]